MSERNTINLSEEARKIILSADFYELSHNTVGVDMASGKDESVTQFLDANLNPIAAPTFNTKHLTFP